MSRRFSAAALALAAPLVLCLVAPARAQSAPNQGLVVRDGSVGDAPGGVVQPGTDDLGQQADYLIRGDLGRQVGSNLLHSFERFGVGSGETASFTGQGLPAGAPAVETIIGRVTGGEVSDIDGTLRSTFPGADLYVLNPAGILFGPDASLDVGGAFVATTADRVGFGADALHASPALDASADSILRVPSPDAFGLLGEPSSLAFDAESPAGIRVEEAVLGVGEGRRLALVGGDLSVAADPFVSFQLGIPTLSAPQGSIELVSLASPGDLDWSGEEPDLSDFAALGAVEIENTFADASGDRSGRVLIRGGTLQVDFSNLFADSLGDGSAPGGPARGGIDFETRGTMELVDVFITSDGFGSTQAGDFRLAAGSLRAERSALGSFAFEPASAGQVELTAEDSIELAGVELLAGALDRPDGLIRLSAPRIDLSDETLIEALGDQARLEVQATDLELGGESSLKAFRFAPDRPGDIVVDVDRLRVIEGSQIGSNNGIGQGDGGETITITAQESVEIVGDPGFFGTGIMTDAIFSDAGEISITSPLVVVRGSGGVITSNAVEGTGGRIVLDLDRLELLGGGSVDTFAIQNGEGGDVEITARESIEISGFSSSRSGIFSAGAEGTGGNIRISVPELHVSDLASIQTAGELIGTGGTVEIDVDHLRIDSGAQIATGNFDAAEGGSLVLTARGAVEIAGRAADGTPSGLFGTSFGTGTGGSIEVEAESLALGPGAFVSTQAVADGDAGPLQVRAGAVSLEDAALDSTSFGAGDGGDLDVQARDSIVLRGGKIRSNAEGEGIGGSIVLQAQRVDVAQGHLTATSSGAGEAGGIRIEAADWIALRPGSSASVEAQAADGGDIELRAGRLVDIEESGVTASVRSGTGNGGNIRIDPVFVVLDGATLIADAFGGNGGNIRIVAENLFVSPDSIVRASSQLGVEGTVDITAPEVDLAGSIATLPESPLDAASRLREACAVRGSDVGGSFAVLDRDGVPPGPDGWLAAGAGLQLRSPGAR